MKSLFSEHALCLGQVLGSSAPSDPKGGLLLHPLYSWGNKPREGLGLAQGYLVSQGILTPYLGPSLGWGWEEPNLADATLPISP